MPNQGGVPVPQDVHPQHYQAPGVGAPPGPQWGPPPGPTPSINGPSPAQAGPTHDWNRRLADIQQPQAQPQPTNPYNQHDPVRGPPSQRPMSPRPDPMRQYHDQHRHTPVRRTPPPGINHAPLHSYPAPQALPQPQSSVPPPSGSNRLTNPAYAGSDSGIRFAPNSQPNGAAGPGAPFGRGGSPPPEIKPIADARPPSPEMIYQQQHQSQHQHQQYQHHPNTSQTVGIAAGAPPPVAALAAAEAAARERDDRPSTSFKRTHESDEEHKTPNKSIANGESRSRLEDHRHRRPSPPDRKLSPRPIPSSARDQGSPRERQTTPPTRHSRNSSVARRDEQRRVDDNYHPSEAAHHPPSLPPIQQQQQKELPPATTGYDDVRDERKDAYEAAARKLNVDEDYDDDPEEEKRKEEGTSRNSPAKNTANGQGKSEMEI